MFAECTIQYDTKYGGNIYVFVEKQILVFLFVYQGLKVILHGLS